jgi:hypothetical protein
MTNTQNPNLSLLAVAYNQCGSFGSLTRSAPGIGQVVKAARLMKHRKIDGVDFIIIIAGFPRI